MCLCARVCEIVCSLLARSRSLSVSLSFSPSCMHLPLRGKMIGEILGRVCTVYEEAQPHTSSVALGFEHESVCACLSLCLCACLCVGVRVRACVNVHACACYCVSPRAACLHCLSSFPSHHSHFPIALGGAVARAHTHTHTHARSSTSTSTLPTHTCAQMHPPHTHSGRPHRRVSPWQRVRARGCEEEHTRGNA